MPEVYLTGSELACAFPVAVRDDACFALSTLPATRLLGHNFSVLLGNEAVTLPTRIYNDPKLARTESLTDLQREFVDCLLTRHCNGFVREEHLLRIIRSEHVWVSPFVIQLVGEYVIEILRAIDQNLQNLNLSVYAGFLRANRGFFATTDRRVISYWNCYYRAQRREEYVGFHLLDFFRSLVRNDG